MLGYTALAVVMTVGSSGVMATHPRELLPAFPLLLPIAYKLAERSGTTASLLTSAIALGGLWFGAYSLTVWPFAI